MSDPSVDELRLELADLVGETRRHLQWLADAGVRSVRIEGAAQAGLKPLQARPPVATSDVARARPSFLQEPARPPVQTPTRPTLVPPPALADTPQAAPVAAREDQSLADIRTDLGDCRRCGLCGTRQQIVYGQGDAAAELVFVGEGPGEEEDASGQPFVGRAGQLLTKMIEAMGYSREQVYICHIVKCRPPGNRRPEPVEIESCRPFVERQLRAIKPKAIVALGATATQALLRTDVSISRLRNEWQAWEGIPVMPTFHPSYLLRAPQEKGKAWDDLQKVMVRLGKSPSTRK